MYYFFSNLLSPFINFSNLIIIIILVFIFLKKFNRYFYFLAFFFAFISILPVGKFLEYHLLSKKYFSNKNINGYDAIIVLGGYDKRIYHAITLHKKNKNSKLIFLGGTRYLFADKNQSEANRFKFFTYDLNKNNIIVSDTSRNTIENFKDFKKIQAKEKFKNIILVTSPWHYNRSLKIAEKFNIDLTPYLWPAEIKPKNFIQYYQSFDINLNLLNFNRLFREVLGYLVVILT